MNEIAQDYQMQGFSMMGVEKYKEAAALFVKSLEIEKNAEVYMDLGNAYASMEAYDDAITAFSNALTLDPDNGEILFDIGCVYLLQERLKKCIEYYNRAEAAGYDNARLYINMAAIYQAMGDRQMELRSYTKAIDKNPLIGELYVKKAELFIDMHRYAEALETLDDMRRLFPDAFEGYDLAARIYSAQGKKEDAIQILKKGLDRFPKDVNLRISLIALYIEMRDEVHAEEMIEELKHHEYAETFQKAIRLQEVSLASLKNQPEVMYDLLCEIVDAEEEGKCDEQSRYMLMMTAVLLKRYEKALEMADVLEMQESGSSFMVSGLYYKGEILLSLNQKEAARAQFQKAARKLRLLSMSNRTYYECYLYRALAHKQLEEYDKAIEMGEYIVNLQSDRPDGYMILADIYKAMGEDEKSQQYFRMAQEKEPELAGR